MLPNDGHGVPGEGEGSSGGGRSAAGSRGGAASALVTLVRGIVQFVVFFAFYVLLSGQIHDRKLMGLGALGCVAVVALGAHLKILDGEAMPIRHWFRTAIYLPWLMWQVVIANWDVFRRVWKRKLEISPRMIEIEHGLRTPYAIATFANSITLTPGTVTAHVGPRTVRVHALTEQAARDLESGEMLRRVKWIEGGHP